MLTPKNMTSNQGKPALLTEIDKQYQRRLDIALQAEYDIPIVGRRDFVYLALSRNGGPSAQLIAQWNALGYTVETVKDPSGFGNCLKVSW